MPAHRKLDVDDASPLTIDSANSKAHVGGGGPYPGHTVGDRRAQWLRHRYDELMETAAHGPGATWVSGCTSPVGAPGWRLRRQPTACVCARTSSRAVEAEEPATKDRDQLGSRTNRCARRPMPPSPSSSVRQRRLRHETRGPTVPQHVTRPCLPMADDGAADRHEHQTYDPRQRDNGHVGHLSCAQILLIPEPGGRYFDRYGTSRRGRCGGGRRPTHLGRSAGNDRVGHMYLATETSPGRRRRNSDRRNDRRGVQRSAAAQPAAARSPAEL